MAMPGAVCGVPSSQSSLPLVSTLPPAHTPQQTFLELLGPGQWLGPVLGELLFAPSSPSISQSFKAPMYCQERILHEAPEVVH